MCGTSIQKSSEFAVHDSSTSNLSLVYHIAKLQLAEIEKAKPAEWVKINVDGYFHTGSNMRGVSAVFRDEVGSYTGGFVCYVCRTANVASNGMARLAVSSSIDFCWYEEPLNLIVEAISDVA
ncbi:unnamed protein product [Malus baccata var. baccata]